MFTEFLKEERSDLFPYLIIIRKVKLLRAKQSDLESLQQKQKESNRHSSNISSTYSATPKTSLTATEMSLVRVYSS